MIIDKCEVVANGIEAFWACIREYFPGVQSGDFPVDAEIQFEAACQQALNIWLEYNHDGIAPIWKGKDK